MNILETRAFSKEMEKISLFKFIPRTFKAIGLSAKSTLPILGLTGAGAVVYGAAKLPEAIKPGEIEGGF